MTVYVDDVFDWPSDDWRNGQWCHMWCDGDEAELHAVAARIGMKRSWFQSHDPRFHHYDLRPHKRELALENGAHYMPLKQWIREGMSKRAPKKAPWK